jgi:lysozyme
MNISESGLHLIEEFEGLRLERYDDSVGVPTIGYGTTEGALGHPVPESCTQEEAEAWLKAYVAGSCEPAINALNADLNQNQYDALCSFTYNLGAGIFDGTGVGNYLREKNYEAAANDMLNYDHAGGEVLEGLRTRREAERKLFLTPAVAAAPVEEQTPNPSGVVEFKGSLNVHTGIWSVTGVNSTVRGSGVHNFTKQLFIQLDGNSTKITI